MEPCLGIGQFVPNMSTDIRGHEAPPTGPSLYEDSRHVGTRPSITVVYSCIFLILDEHYKRNLKFITPTGPSLGYSQTPSTGLRHRSFWRKVPESDARSASRRQGGSTTQSMFQGQPREICALKFFDLLSYY